MDTEVRHSDRRPCAVETGASGVSPDSGTDPNGDVNRGVTDDADAGVPMTVGTGIKGTLADGPGAYDPAGDTEVVGGRAADAAVCINSEFIAAAALESTRRVFATHSPHQSSSRTCGQTPSTMYDFADTGCNIGPLRRHLPQRTPLSSEWASLRS